MTLAYIELTPEESQELSQMFFNHGDNVTSVEQLRGLLAQAQISAPDEILELLLREFGRNSCFELGVELGPSGFMELCAVLKTLFVSYIATKDDERSAERTLIEKLASADAPAAPAGAVQAIRIKRQQMHQALHGSPSNTNFTWTASMSGDMSLQKFALLEEYATVFDSATQENATTQPTGAAALLSKESPQATSRKTAECAAAARKNCKSSSTPLPTQRSSREHSETSPKSGLEVGNERLRALERARCLLSAEEPAITNLKEKRIPFVALQSVLSNYEVMSAPQPPTIDDDHWDDDNPEMLGDPMLYAKLSANQLRILLTLKSEASSRRGKGNDEPFDMLDTADDLDGLEHILTKIHERYPALSTVDHARDASDNDYTGTDDDRSVLEGEGDQRVPLTRGGTSRREACAVNDIRLDPRESEAMILLEKRLFLSPMREKHLRGIEDMMTPTQEQLSGGAAAYHELGPAPRPHLPRRRHAHIHRNTVRRNGDSLLAEVLHKRGAAPWERC